MLGRQFLDVNRHFPTHRYRLFALIQSENVFTNDKVYYVDHDLGTLYSFKILNGIFKVSRNYENFNFGRDFAWEILKDKLRSTKVN